MVREPDYDTPANAARLSNHGRTVDPVAEDQTEGIKSERFVIRQCHLVPESSQIGVAQRSLAPTTRNVLPDHLGLRTWTNEVAVAGSGSFLCR